MASIGQTHFTNAGGEAIRFFKTSRAGSHRPYPNQLAICWPILPQGSAS